MSTTLNIENKSVRLSNGKTGYQILGNQDARHWVLVFGGYHFPRNCDLFFQDLASDLGDDYAFLLYDYFGRGESDAPDGLYDVDMYMAQVAELIDKAGFEDKQFIVLGYSFGGATSTQFCNRFPDRAKVLIQSGAWATWEPFPAATTIMCKLGLANVLYKAYWKAMPGALRDGFDDAASNADVIANMLKVEQEIMDRTPGNLKKSILGTFRNFSRNTRDQVKENGKHSRPVLLVWGKNDKIAPFRMAEAMHRVTPQSKLIGLDGNHNDLWLVPEKAQVLRAEIVAFLHNLNR